MARRYFLQWAAMTAVAAAFFTLMPLAVAPPNGRPPVLVAVLFPAAFVGLVTLIRYFREARRL